MANELTLNGSIVYDDGNNSGNSLSITDLLASVTTKKSIRHQQSIGTSEEAIVLGEVTSPGWAIFINRDTTNFIELRVATGGAKFAKLLPGEFCLLRLGAGAQVPFAIADTSACLMDYILVMT